MEGKASMIHEKEISIDFKFGWLLIIVMVVIIVMM